MESSIIFELDQDDSSHLEAELKAESIDYELVELRSAIGADTLQMIVAIAAPIISTFAAVISAYVARNGQVIIIDNGIRRTIKNEEDVQKFIEELESKQIT